jgi:hypothetical protein
MVNQVPAGQHPGQDGWLVYTRASIIRYLDLRFGTLTSAFVCGPDRRGDRSNDVISQRHRTAEVK